MAPCEVNDTTSPWVVLPTGNAATKLMNVSGSFTAGGGTFCCLCCLFCRPRPEREPEAGSALASEPLPSTVLPGGASFLALALFSGAAFLATACFLAAPRDFSGLGGCSASSTASSMALENTGFTLARPGGGAAGVIGQEVSTGGGGGVGDVRARFRVLDAFFAALASSAALAGAD